MTWNEIDEVEGQDKKCEQPEEHDLGVWMERENDARSSPKLLPSQSWITEAVSFMSQFTAHPVSSAVSTDLSQISLIPTSPVSNSPSPNFTLEIF